MKDPLSVSDDILMNRPDRPLCKQVLHSFVEEYRAS
jgi:hypothetical protein